jgi:type I restriction enzyme R subunit
MPPKPEERARQVIDQLLEQAGWLVQDHSQLNIHAVRGVAVREFKLAKGHGKVDYLLFVDAQPVGVLEAKPAGYPLASVELQALKYSEGLPEYLDPPVRSLPFAYLSTGSETRFTNHLDPHPRSRRVFSFHQPGTLAEWLDAVPVAEWAAGWAEGLEDDGRPSTLRSRIQHLPRVDVANLWQNKVEAITNLEASLRRDKPRALIQMATGSGKTLLAVTSIYRLIKYAGARRVLFLVDRANLGEQAEKELQGYRTPDDNRKLTELYNVQRLTSNAIAEGSKVVITTIQRLYSMLKGEPGLDVEAEEASLFESSGLTGAEPLPVVYDRAIPPEYFDVVFVDECHRSIYTLWRQVLEYFDAYLIGLTATPAKHTFGFFNQNLVMEYPHEQAVADGVNVDFEIYRIRTRITQHGSTIEASPLPLLGFRDRKTREVRWEAPDEPVIYESGELDRKVVAKDQIRTIVQTFRDKVTTEIFPGRDEVPKTLIFAKDDSHAEDIVGIVREEFGRGNQFARKITYKTTEGKPADLIQDFRTSYYPRIAVTVDMVATGTDVKPIEIVMFMRSVKSRVLFEQMKGRGVRVIDETDLRAVSPDARAKTHFVIVDCVEITETDMADTHPLERKPTVGLKALLDQVAVGTIDPQVYSSLASRLARLDKKCGPQESKLIEEASDGVTLKDLTRALIAALDPDNQVESARRESEVPEGERPTDEQVEKAGRAMLHEAARPLATRPAFRQTILDVKRDLEQIIDEVSEDAVLYAGISEEARLKAKAMVTSFERFLEEHKDEITALQFFYSVDYRDRLHYADIKALAEAIGSPPRSWTPETLWHAYEILDQSRVRGASGRRLLTDVVSLVRYAIQQADELVPYQEQVQERFRAWLGQQTQAGKRFTPQQIAWLEMIRDHISTSLEIEVEDFSYTPFAEEGGLGRARQVFGEELGRVLEELNEVLAA